MSDRGLPEDVIACLLWGCFIIFTGFRLRAIDGPLKGLWLIRIDVTKGGTPFLGRVNWQAIALGPDQFQTHPKFLEDESAALSAFTKEIAQTFQTIVLSHGVQTEIIEP